LRARAIAGLSIFIVALLSGCTGLPVSKALQFGAPRTLPTFSNAAVPGGFVGVIQRCTAKGTAPCFDVLALFSTENGAEQRTLAKYPLQRVQTTARNVGISYPSRGPTGDVWFVLTEPFCRSELYRIDARTGHIALVLKLCGLTIRSPAQSPNGRFVAYILESADLNGSSLVIRNLATGREREILPLDAHGNQGSPPRSMLPVRITSPPNPGGFQSTNPPPGPERFLFGITWSLDSAKLGVGHLSGVTARVCGPPIGPPNSCFLYPDRAFDVFDVASLNRLVQLHGPGRCQINSSAFDAAGLAIAQFCNIQGDSDASVVQYAPDLRTRLFEVSLPKCAIEPFLVVGGVQNDVALVSTYDYCPKSPWPGKPPLKAIGPQQLIDVLEDGRLRTVLVYPSGGEQLREVDW